LCFVVMPNRKARVEERRGERQRLARVLYRKRTQRRRRRGLLRRRGPRQEQQQQQNIRQQALPAQILSNCGALVAAAAAETSGIAPPDAMPGASWHVPAKAGKAVKAAVTL
jgi:hypothetical protein